MFTSPLALLSTLALVAGAACAKNITVTVGGTAGLVFTPETIKADIGDLVIFDFKAKAHSVTQSTFAKPCELMKNGSITGFDSGIVPNPDGTLQKTLIIEVTQTAPLWIHCTPHCGVGMVGAINAPETGEKTFAAYKALAMGSGGASNSTAPAAGASGASSAAAPAATLPGSGRASSAAAGASGTAGAGAAGASASAGAGGTTAGATTGDASSLASLSSVLLVLPVAFAGVFFL